MNKSTLLKSVKFIVVVFLMGLGTYLNVDLSVVTDIVKGLETEDTQVVEAPMLQDAGK